MAAACVLWFAASAHAQTGTISGTVTDAGTGMPPLTVVSVQRYGADGVLMGTVATNALGEYTFTGTLPGVYFLKILPGGPFIPELYDNIKCVALDCPPTGGTPVTVVAGATTTANFALDIGGLIVGSVRRASDNGAVTTGSVLLFNASTSFVTSVNTALDGSFVFSALPTGTYYARAGYRPTAQRQALAELYGGVLCPEPAIPDPLGLPTVDSSCRINAGTPISVTQGVGTNGINFLLDPIATISGTVVADGTSAPLGGIVVAVFSGETEVARAQTVGSGGYIVSGLSPGTYRVRTISDGIYADEWLGNICIGCAGTPQPLVVALGANATAVDFSLAQGGAIAGTVSCQTGPLSDFLRTPVISVFNASGTLVRSLASVGSSCILGTMSRPYSIGGLPPGQYYLLARDPLITPFGIQPWGGSFVDKLYGDVLCITVDCDVRRGAPVTVTQGATTTGIDFVIQRGADSTTLSSTLHPLRMFDSRGVELVGVVRTNISPPPAQWQVVGLPPGTYFAKFGNQLHGGVICTDCPPTSGTPIVIRPGDLTFNLNFPSPPTAGQRISGTVSAGSTPLSTIAVELISDGGQLLQSTLTDHLGRYTLTSVPSGLYYLRTRNDRGYADEIYQDVDCGSCDPRMGAPVTVGASDVTGVDFALAAGGLLTGDVREATTNVILPNVPLSVFTAGGVLAGRTASTDSGVYRLSLPTGSYRVRAEATVSHGAELFSELPCTTLACDVPSATAVPIAPAVVTPNINFTLTSCGAMTLSPGILATGVAGTAYRQVFTVAGGAGAKTFRLTSGVLPAGLSLDPAGTLAGTPTLSGRYAIAVGAVDEAGCATARALTLDVQDCAFTLSPAGATVPVAGGDVTITIGGSCGSQSVNPGSFATVQSNTVGQVVLTVQPNTAPEARSAAVTIGRRVFALRQAGQSTTPPIGAFDAPLDGSQVSGALPVGGWALDDLEVIRVQIFRDPLAGEGPAQVFLGNAVFVRGARPDVARAFATYPQNDRAGWGFLILTNMLPNQGNGPFRIYAYADDAEGGRTLLGAKTIVAVNAAAVTPFGNIDTPGQGATISGSSYINFGWALTPQPKIIPTDGSQIGVFVDGMFIGTVSYNHFRADIAALFPGLANTGGAVGYRLLDTTALAEGQHTIAWIAHDSRYFTVANSADAQPGEQGGAESGRRTESLAAAPVAESTVVAQQGEGERRQLPASEDGARTARLKALERLELSLETPAAEGACAATWAGYLVDAKTLGPLPVGASIDPTGTFFWQPGPGFVGKFDLMFVRTACDGGKTRMPLTVTIDK
jgi:hypothetical protein